MSLNFNVAAVKDHAVITTHPADEKRWHPVTEALVWASIPCGFNRITETNLEDVVRRLHQYQSIVGPLVSFSDRDVKGWITEEDLRLHIGLTTNADAVSEARWPSKLADIAYNAADYTSRRAESAHSKVAAAAAKEKEVATA